MSANVVQDLFARVGFVTDNASAKKVESFLGNMKTALGAFVAYKGFSFFRGMIDQTSEIAGAAVDMSAKLGISAESVQELDFAAKQSGTSIDGLKGGLTGIAGNLEEARKGAGPLAEGLKKLGISTRDPAVRAGDLDAILMKVADGIAAMPEGAGRAAASMKVFGKSGSDLLPFLSEGAAGIARMRQEARDLGGVISNETAASLEAFGDEQEKVSFSIQGLKNEIVIALLPALREMTAKFLAWMKVNRKVLAEKIAGVIKGIGRALLVVGEIVKGMMPVLGFMIDHWKILTAAILVFKSASIGAAVASGVSWAIATAPLLIMAALIAAVVLIVQDLWVAFTGGRSVLKDLYLAFKEWVGDGIGGVLLTIIETVVKFIATIVGGIAKIVEMAVTAVGKLGDVGRAGSRWLKEKTGRNLPDIDWESVGLDAQLGAMAQDKTNADSNWFNRAQSRAATAPVFPLGGSKSSTVNAPVTTTINVHSATGNPKEISESIKASMDDVFKARARTIQHATGSGGVP